MNVGGLLLVTIFSALIVIACLIYLDRREQLRLRELNEAARLV